MDPVTQRRIPADVYVLVDRVAAAFMRSDVPCARELVDSARLNWEERARRYRDLEVARAIDLDMESKGNGYVYFKTKDGLTALDIIPGCGGRWPDVYKRAELTTITWKTRGSDKPSDIRVRSYELRSRAVDGRPVYVEI